MSKIKCASTLFTGAELIICHRNTGIFCIFFLPPFLCFLMFFPTFFPFHWFFLQVLLFVQVGEVNIHCCLLQTDIVVYWISTVCVSVFGVMVVGVPGGDYNHNKMCAQHTRMHTLSVPVSLSLSLSLSLSHTHTHTHTHTFMYGEHHQTIYSPWTTWHFFMEMTGDQ